MVFLSGFKTSPDISGGQIATIFTAPEDVTVSSLKTRITGTGNAAAINVKFAGSIIRTVTFNNLDSVLIESFPRGTRELLAGQSIVFQRDTTSAKYNASANFELTYEPLAVTPPTTDPNTGTVDQLINDVAIGGVWSLDSAATIVMANNTLFYQNQQISATEWLNAWNFFINEGQIVPFTEPPSEPPTEPPTTPPPTLQNVSVLVDMHDNHFISGILTEPDFNNLHSVNSSGWNIIESTFTGENETETFGTMLNLINAHIAGETSEPPTEPPSEPPTTDPNTAAAQNIIDNLINFNYPAFFDNNVTFYQAGQITATELVNAWEFLVNDGLVTPKGGTPPTDPVPNTGMVSQSLGVFDLSDDRLTGEILFIANSAFNPFFYDKTIFSFLSIKDPTGADLVTKQNDLIFNETERDERIFFDEGAFGNTELHLKAFVFSLDSQFNSLAFSEVKEFIVKANEPPVIPPTTTPSGDNISKFLLAAPIIGIAALFLNSARKMKR